MPRNQDIMQKKFLKKSRVVKLYFIKNMGYGAAIKTGLKNCNYEWIFQTDGDAEYDVNDLIKLIKKSKGSDLVVTYRLKKI